MVNVNVNREMQQIGQYFDHFENKIYDSIQQQIFNQKRQYLDKLNQNNKDQDDAESSSESQNQKSLNTPVIFDQEQDQEDNQQQQIQNLKLSNQKQILEELKLEKKRKALIKKQEKEDAKLARMLQKQLNNQQQNNFRDTIYYPKDHQMRQYNSSHIHQRTSNNSRNQFRKYEKQTTVKQAAQMMMKGPSKYGRERKMSKNLQNDDSSQNSSNKNKSSEHNKQDLDESSSKIISKSSDQNILNKRSYNQFIQQQKQEQQYIKKHNLKLQKLKLSPLLKNPEIKDGFHVAKEIIQQRDKVLKQKYTNLGLSNKDIKYREYQRKQYYERMRSKSGNDHRQDNQFDDEGEIILSSNDNLSDSNDSVSDDSAQLSQDNSNSSISSSDSNDSSLSSSSSDNEQSSSSSLSSKSSSLKKLKFQKEKKNDQDLISQTSLNGYNRKQNIILNNHIHTTDDIQEISKKKFNRNKERQRKPLVISFNIGENSKNMNEKEKEAINTHIQEQNKDIQILENNKEQRVFPIQINAPFENVDDDKEPQNDLEKDQDDEQMENEKQYSTENDNSQKENSKINIQKRKLEVEKIFLGEFSSQDKKSLNQQQQVKESKKLQSLNEEEDSESIIDINSDDEFIDGGEYNKSNQKSGGRKASGTGRIVLKPQLTKKPKIPVVKPEKTDYMKMLTHELQKRQNVVDERVRDIRSLIAQNLTVQHQKLISDAIKEQNNSDSNNKLPSINKFIQQDKNLNGKLNEINKDILKQMNLSTLGLKQNESQKVNALLAQQMELSQMQTNLELTNTELIPQSSGPNDNLYESLVQWHLNKNNQDNINNQDIIETENKGQIVQTEQDTPSSNGQDKQLQMNGAQLSNSNCNSEESQSSSEVQEENQTIEDNNEESSDHEANVEQTIQKIQQTEQSATVQQQQPQPSNSINQQQQAMQQMFQRENEFILNPNQYSSAINSMHQQQVHQQNNQYQMADQKKQMNLANQSNQHELMYLKPNLNPYAQNIIYMTPNGPVQAPNNYAYNKLNEANAIQQNYKAQLLMNHLNGVTMQDKMHVQMPDEDIIDISQMSPDPILQHHLMNGNDPLYHQAYMNQGIQPNGLPLYGQNPDPMLMRSQLSSQNQQLFKQQMKQQLLWQQQQDYLLQQNLESQMYGMGHQLPPSMYPYPVRQQPQANINIQYLQKQADLLKEKLRQMDNACSLKNQPSQKLNGQGNPIQNNKQQSYQQSNPQQQINVNALPMMINNQIQRKIQQINTHQNQNLLKMNGGGGASHQEKNGGLCSSSPSVSNSQDQPIVIE